MNNELTTVLLEHYVRYPKMEIQDMVKLIYQNEFAGGHFIHNELASQKRLQMELKGLKVIENRSALFEDIGNGLDRINLDKLKYSTISANTINRFFINTSNSKCGTVENFERKLNILRQLCKQGKLSFSVAGLDRYLKDLKTKCYPPVSHSDDYRRAYSPAYRVVLSEYRIFFELFCKIDSLLKLSKNIIIAIDGNSGSGKSTLSQLIGNTYDCNIFHMDDFFLTPELRTKERLKEPGGNVDYIRFRQEILDKIVNKSVAKYHIYNCSKGTFDRTVQASPKKLNVIEGSYSLHPYLISDYDLKVFLSIGKEKQKSRILKRNGALILKRFVDEWIPLEDKYFHELRIPEKCDIIYKF